MTKSELIAEVEGKSWYLGVIGSPVIEEEYPNYNLRLYRVHVKVLVSENVITNKHLYFYVFDEGQAEEVAYYKDKTPDDQIADTPAT
ncbi:MAG: hypothetical protein DRP09_20225 [Candidatus Thorarchaeota archaeon]|nr:MAG: hypothetical protein DRP09_20225 [Candidatus Thorarchaeota archaeon]